MSALGNRCGFYSRRDVYRTSDLSCKGSIGTLVRLVILKMQALKRCCFKEKMSQASKAPKTISIVIGFFFFINYIVGVGFLGIPAVFSEAGFLTSILTLLAISLLAWTTITWLVEAMARAQVGYVQLLHVCA